MCSKLYALCYYRGDDKTIVLRQKWRILDYLNLRYKFSWKLDWQMRLGKYEDSTCSFILFYISFLGESLYLKSLL